MLTASLTLSPPNFLLFLIHWRANLRYQLANDPAQVLGSTFPALAISIPDTFPKPETVLAYASPTTSWSNGAQGPNLNPNLVHQLDIRQLAGLCEAFFGWPDVPKRFRTLIFPGSVLRMLCEVRQTTVTLYHRNCNMYLRITQPTPSHPSPSPPYWKFFESRHLSAA